MLQLPEDLPKVASDVDPEPMDVPNIEKEMESRMDTEPMHPEDRIPDMRNSDRIPGKLEAYFILNMLLTYPWSFKDIFYIGYVVD